MPPRIIRNSDRLRASDRTMITTQTSISLAKSLRLDWHCRHRQRKPREGQTVQSKTPWANRGGTRTDSGLDIETNHSVSGRGRSFCLTSLFIELIDRILDVSGHFAHSEQYVRVLRAGSLRKSHQQENRDGYNSRVQRYGQALMPLWFGWDQARRR